MKEPFAEQDAHTQTNATHFPADQYLELALLGKILLDQSMDGIDTVKPQDFYFGRHGELYGKMQRIWEGGIEPLDPTLIADRDPELHALMAEAMSIPEPLTPAISYARKVKDLAAKRAMLPLLNSLAEMSMNGATAESILDRMENEVAQRRPHVGSANGFDRWLDQGISAAAAAQLGKIERVYVVQDLIREKSVSIFYGAPGEFKSALCMDLALCIANGLPWLQPLPVEGNKQRAFATQAARVLWLNYDQGHDDIIERLGAMARAYGDGENVTAISQSHPTATLTTESQARALGEFCQQNGYKVLIVDSLLDVKGKADLQEAGMGDVLRLWRIVAETGNVSVIIIAHNTKMTLDLYGSQFIKAKLDHLYYVSRPPGTDVAIIESKKQRNFGEQAKLYARWTWTHYEGTRTLHTARFWGDSTENKPAHPNNTTQSSIHKVLMGSPGRGFTANDLTAILNEDRDENDQLKPHAVRTAASRLVENERNVGKTQTEDGSNLYHYGELTDTFSDG